MERGLFLGVGTKNIIDGDGISHRALAACRGRTLGTARYEAILIDEFLCRPVSSDRLHVLIQAREGSK